MNFFAKFKDISDFSSFYVLTSTIFHQPVVGVCVTTLVVRRRAEVISPVISVESESIDSVVAVVRVDPRRAMVI